MPNVALKGSICSGHDCFPPRDVIQYSPNVFAEGREVARDTDAVRVHCCISCHGRNLAGGSATVFVNNLRLAHLGTPVNCGGNVVSDVANTVYCAE